MRFLFRALTLSTVLAVPILLRAQLPARRNAPVVKQPNLVLTFYVGAVTGKSLWAVTQPLCVLDSSNQCTSQFDSLALLKDVQPTTIVGTGATFFPWQHVGFHAELGWLGLRFQETCASGFFNPDPDDKNAQVCDDINTQRMSSRSLSVLGGITVRASQERPFSPYIRGTVGISRLSRSPVTMHGRYETSSFGTLDRMVIDDASRQRTAFVGGIAFGFSATAGRGSAARVEIRDHLAKLGVVTGPSNAGTNPTAKRFSHFVSVAVGIDVVLRKPNSERP